jgi:Tol biopolymer transport system component/DNA-binding winged helix-turn-helix (wHTH) protein
MTSNESNRARFGPYEVDLHTSELWKYGTRLKLVGQPFEILAMLLHCPGELVTRDEMQKRLWPSDTFVDFNHGLNAAVNKLREALSDSADAPRYIETLPRRGYRFIAAIEWLPAKAQVAALAVSVPPDSPAESPSVTASTGDDAVTADTACRPRPPYLLAASAVVALLIVSGLAISLFRRQLPQSNHATVERIRPLVSVADTRNPSFSPDGNFVAFSHNGLHGSGIFISRVGSDQFRQLTSDDTDCCPVWSPDGRSIAFSRLVGNQHNIFLVAADDTGQKREAENAVTAHNAVFTLATATAERRLDSGGVVPSRGEMDWSPDGNTIVFSGPSGIYLLSPQGSAVRRIAETPPAAEDWGPQFSPDGSQIIFVRNWQVGEPDEVWTVPANGGMHTRLFTERGRITSPPQWSSDGHSVIYSSNRTGHPELFRVALDAPDFEAVIREAGSPVWDPAISRHGYRLAYERLIRSLSIWQLDLSDPNRQPSLLVSSTSDTDQGPGPQFTPDGKKIAYMSDRNGTMEIWVANRDGSNPYQLTAVGGAGTPRWSPDSQSVVFDVNSTSGEKIVTMSLNGGGPRVLTEGIVPSWSRDGKWVYFSSSRNGGYQVWKVPATGGTATQVTHNGGHAALESLDGKYLYYAKNSQAEPEVWRVPVDGGEETPLPLVRPGTWASWQVVDGGIIFVGPSLGHQAAVSFFDVAKNRTSTVTVLERTPFWLGASPDGKTIVFDQPGREQSQAMLVENFR